MSLTIATKTRRYTVKLEDQEAEKRFDELLQFLLKPSPNIVVNAENIRDIITRSMNHPKLQPPSIIQETPGGG